MKNSHGDSIFILIVESQVGKMEAVYTTLLREGYEYGFAKNREEAMKIMSTRLFDFVIMDFSMPGMTGEEFQKILSTNESKTNIIFTYSKTNPSPEIFMKDCQWLAVPFHTEELLNLLQFEAQSNGF
jgi:DNA-binding response OmpR family regulator